MTTSNEPTPIQNEIARQIAAQKPAHLRPGVDVVFVAVMESGREGIGVWVRTDDTKALVMYDAGRDTYVVSRKRVTDEATQAFDDVYVDQLGDLIFGTDAEAFTEPMVQIYSADENGDWKLEAEF